MAEPQLVADCVKAMRDAVVDRRSRSSTASASTRSRSYEFVRDFVGTVAEAGCQTFIVHARNAMLKGLSPEGKPRDPAAALRSRVPAEARFPGARDHHQRRHQDATTRSSAPAARRRRDARARGLPQPLYDGRLGCALLRRQLRRVQVARRGAGSDDALYQSRCSCERYGRRWTSKLNSITRHMLGLMAGLPGRAASARCCPTRKSWRAPTRPYCSRRWLGPSARRLAAAAFNGMETAPDIVSSFLPIHRGGDPCQQVPAKSTTRSVPT